MVKVERLMKNSGIPWLGDIPQDWQIKRLKRVLKVISGSTPDTNKADYWDGNITWITPDDLGNITDKYIYESKRMITNSGYENCGTTLAPKDSLIVSTRAPIGHIGITTENTCTNQGCRSLILQNKLDDIKYFFYLLYSAKDELNSRGNGTTFKELSKTETESIIIPTPNIEEQKLIAEFLDWKREIIDKIILEKERQIELLGERRQAVISQAVTKGLDPTVPMKPSSIPWLGDIPEHWEVKRIKDYVKVNDKSLTERTDPNLAIKYIDIGAVDSEGNVSITDDILFADAPSRARRIVIAGDTLISTVRTYLKAITFCEILEPNLICSTGFAVLTPKKKILPLFLYYWARSNYIISEIVSRSVGVSYPAINAPEIGNLCMPLITLQEQQEIVDFINSETTQIDGIVQTVLEQIEKLKEYRQAVISAAVTGKIDLRDYSSNVQNISEETELMAH